MPHLPARYQHTGYTFAFAFPPFPSLAFPPPGFDRFAFVSYAHRRYRASLAFIQCTLARKQASPLHLGAK
jgi:hypothetical protein